MGDKYQSHLIDTHFGRFDFIIHIFYSIEKVVPLKNSLNAMGGFMLKSYTIKSRNAPWDDFGRA